VSYFSPSVNKILSEYGLGVITPAISSVETRGRPRLRTDEEILRAALMAFAEYGYDGMSLRTLNSKLGLSRGAINQRYRSKERLWYAAVDRGFVLPTMQPALQALDRMAAADLARRVPARAVLFLIAHGAAAPFTLGPLSERFDAIDGPLDPMAHVELVTDIILAGILCTSD
jgi:AcrR family transcriptional regulator